ncbi:lysophospholipase [Cubamyces lactineus]|nr:lysophospholipase [Cubamyces lactineus]
MAPEPSETPTYIEAWLNGPNGHPFYTRTYLPSSPSPTSTSTSTSTSTAAPPPPKAVLLFVHGYNDHIARHADTHAAFAQRGLAVFAYDMRGFGRTALDEAHRAAGEGFGRTSRALELEDLEWWVRYVARVHARGAPIFLMGYSSGGGLTLAYPTRKSSPPSAEAVSLIAGVIGVSPLLTLVYPPSQLTKHAVRMMSAVWPNCPVPAMQPYERFSRDIEVQKALSEDPLRRPHGTALGLYDMVTQGEELLKSGWERWPQDLPMFILWGAADEINSPKDGIAFFEKVRAKDKELVTYPDALHEIMHEVGDIPARFVEDCVGWIEARIARPQSLPA